MDLPLIAFQHGLFILPFYFLAKLQVDAGKFFFFYLTLFLSTVNFSNLLRAFAYYVSSLDDCEYFNKHCMIQIRLISGLSLGFRYGGTACTICILFAGFLIPPANLPKTFGWLHYVDPLFYAFENVCF